IVDEDAAKVVDGVAPKVTGRNASTEQVKKLYNLSDCTQLEVPTGVFKGIVDEDAAKVVDGVAPKITGRNALTEQVKKFYNLSDCTQFEVSINF
nr:succinate--CoA ligase [ADP-forming] subunit beta, mitochondrial [Tanacetum cinerariifolium]